MTLLAPLVLLGPVMLLLSAVLALGRRGPVGVVAAGVLLLVVAAGVRWAVRAGWTWWGRTKAAERADGTSPWVRRR